MSDLPPFSKEELSSIRAKAGTGYIPTIEEVARFVKTIRQSFSSLPSKGKKGEKKKTSPTKDEDIDFF